MTITISGTDLTALEVAKQLLAEHPQQLEGVDNEKKGEFLLYAKRPDTLVYEQWADHEIKRQLAKGEVVAEKTVPLTVRRSVKMKKAA